MINWLFVWSSKRPPVWEATIQNMNQAITSPYTQDWEGNSWISPVNWKDIPTRVLTDDHKKYLNGQLLSQFENESFKFVIESNNTSINHDDGLIIKPHLIMNLGITKNNSRTLNLDKIYKHLENHEWVSLGLFIGNTPPSPEERSNLLSRSVLYARNADEKLIDLDNNVQLPDNDYISCITYINFKKLKDDKFVVCTLNPNLVAVPHLDEGILDDKHRFLTLDTYDSTLDDYLLTPNIEDAKVINGNNIFAKLNKPFKIKLYEQSLMRIKFVEIADFPVEVETNIRCTVKDNVYEFTPDKSMGYVSFKINTNFLSDKYNSKTTAGITTLEYVVIGE